MDRSDARDARPFNAERHLAGRLGVLILVWLVPISVIAVRLIGLQVGIGEDYFVPYREVTEETIPARDGRILANGRILAHDVEHFDVYAHYRWIEEPANPDWLRSQALARLTPDQRDDPDLVVAAETAVIGLRRSMWHDLARISRKPADTIAARTGAIQRSVQRISDDVNRRHDAEREADEPADGSGQTSDTRSHAPWRALAASIVEELTTPPRRRQRERIVVREEVSDHRVLTGVGLPVAAEIKAHPERFPGLRVRTSLSRRYPHGSLAAHVLGLRMRISDDDLAERRRRYNQADPYAVDADDRAGKSGVELTYDRHLRGIDGQLQIVRDRYGNVVQTKVLREPRHGRDIVLTIEAELQASAESILEKALRVPSERTGGPANDEDSQPIVPLGGCVVAVDVRTGAIRAAASAPAFDLNPVASGERDAWDEVLGDPRRPLFSRITQMAIPPGSVFKTLSAIAMIQTGAINPDEGMLCRGYLDQPEEHRCLIYRHYGRGHGVVDLDTAIAQSCNVYFFSGARRMGMDGFLQWARRFEFGQPTGIDLPSERPGTLPASDRLGLAIGQSRLTVTPLQVARLMAAVANGGELVRPHVVEPSMPAGGMSDLPSGATRRRVNGLDSSTLSRLRGALRRVVQEPGGTGYRTVHHDQVAIAGKTGTAESGGGRADHAWFAGYVPADRPRIAFVVVLEHGGSGGRVAGPAARTLVQSMIDSGTINVASARQRDDSLNATEVSSDENKGDEKMASRVP